MSEATASTELVKSLRAFAEMPLEGGCVDPLIEVMNSLARRAADRLEELEEEIKQNTLQAEAFWIEMRNA